MKNVISILCVILAAVAVFVAVQNSQKSMKAMADLDRERYDRMISEENLETTKSKVVSLEGELSRVQNKMAAVEKKVAQLVGEDPDGEQ